jgi:hypothetical protein
MTCPKCGSEKYCVGVGDDYSTGKRRKLVTKAMCSMCGYVGEGIEIHKAYFELLDSREKIKQLEAEVAELKSLAEIGRMVAELDNMWCVRKQEYGTWTIYEQAGVSLFVDSWNGDTLLEAFEAMEGK